MSLLAWFQDVKKLFEADTDAEAEAEADADADADAEAAAEWYKEDLDEAGAGVVGGGTRLKWIASKKMTNRQFVDFFCQNYRSLDRCGCC